MPSMAIVVKHPRIIQHIFLGWTNVVHLFRVGPWESLSLGLPLALALLAGVHVPFLVVLGIASAFEASFP